MKDTKRRLETFSFYDRTGLEEHLARMAAEGWLLDKIGQFLWHYRRIEPKKLTFSVTYFPKASAFDPEPSEEQETFYDFCRHTGWVLAASSAQLQVFYNEGPDPVPIETDPVLEVESIHRTMKRSFLPSQLMLLALAVLDVGLLVWRLIDDPIGLLASPASVLTAMCWVLVFVLAGVEPPEAPDRGAGPAGAGGGVLYAVGGPVREPDDDGGGGAHVLCVRAGAVFAGPGRHGVAQTEKGVRQGEPGSDHRLRPCRGLPLCGGHHLRDPVREHSRLVCRTGRGDL